MGQTKRSTPRKTTTKKEPKVGIYLSHEDAKMPTRAYEHDVGYDLYAIEDVEIMPGTVQLVKTGVHLSLPDDVFAQINTRSSHGKVGVYSHHGVIDPGYTGEVSVWVMNVAAEVEDTGVIKKNPFLVEKGNKIGQILFHKAYTPEITQIKKLPETDRGDKGHGSSGQ